MENNGDKSFRDSISTVSSSGNRVWVYPKKPFGKFYNTRTVVSIFLLVIFAGLPFLKINGEQALLLNFLERKFVFFGFAFGPYDFNIFVFIFISFIVFIILFTAIYGRIFCGWLCPQTIFMEMVFRKIEYFIEGDYRKQLKLKEQSWNAEKILKKGGKLLIFAALAVIMSHIVLSYIIGSDQVLKIINDSPFNHIATFIAVYFNAGIIFFVYGWFREQSCTIVCPYGRLQGVLLDDNTIVIAYDHKRGEPRGKIEKGKETDKGDCVDDLNCVRVCPTGIDIRNGLQLECVNCTACIDACDDVMDRVGRPRGLIKYASHANIEENKDFRLTPRIILYSILLVLLIAFDVYLLSNRTPLEVNLLRTPGMLYQDQPDDKISNLYNIHIINKTFDPRTLEFNLLNYDGKITVLGEDLNIGSQENYEGKLMIVLNKEDLKTLKIPLEIEVVVDGERSEVINTTFLSDQSKKK